jgi:hypothetical protein
VQRHFVGSTVGNNHRANCISLECGGYRRFLSFLCFLSSGVAARSTRPADLGKQKKERKRR